MEKGKQYSLFQIDIPGISQVDGDQPVRVGEYSIPPGVDVYPGLRYIMLDEDHWDRPYQFRPERFIEQETGELIRNNPRYIPFQVREQGKGFFFYFLPTFPNANKDRTMNMPRSPVYHGHDADAHLETCHGIRS